MKWNLRSSVVPKTLEELQEVLLQNRQIQNPQNFFDPPHPLAFTLADVGLDESQMLAAVTRILQARDNKEDVLIFGDYDADGICATAVLWEGLKAAGVIARPFIPHREKHGYGISLRSLEDVLKDKKPDLIITVDNGIVAHAAFAFLREQGIDAILTDHHLPEVDAKGDTLYPSAVAVVHSPQLCGTTVAWFLARELDAQSAERSLDLTAIATIADQMSLLGVSRSFVKHGLTALQQTERVGIQLLCAKSGIELKDITVNSINFAIAPRINAMGRLKHGLDALRLLCTKSMTRADELVAELNTTNSTRQELTGEMIQHALEQAEDWKDEHIIIVSSPEYHEGVIGLIAGKLMEQFYKPAIVLAVNDKTAKASARSIPGVNIIELIRQVKDDLLEAGGHPMAAGFAVEKEKLDVMKKKLQKFAAEQIAADMLTPSIDVDCLIPSQLLDIECVECLQDLAPFGQQNREPIFGLQNVTVLSAEVIGRDGRHLRMTIRPEGEETMTLSGIGWGMAHHIENLALNTKVNVAFVAEINEWKGKQKLQLTLKDISQI